MSIQKELFLEIRSGLEKRNTQLIAVSKTKPIEDIQALYDLGQRDFGENYVQELMDKHAALPKDIRWHFIGHLQTNKAKNIVPFVHLIHGVDSLKLLKEIDKQAAKINRVVDVLLQVYIAQEETKFGMDETELTEAIAELPALTHIRVTGLMGMASFTSLEDKIRKEFRQLKKLFDKLSANNHPSLSLSQLSMGMSADYPIAIEEGSTMVRLGSILFGAREKKKAGE